MKEENTRFLAELHARCCKYGHKGIKIDQDTEVCYNAELLRPDQSSAPLRSQPASHSSARANANISRSDTCRVPFSIFQTSCSLEAQTVSVNPSVAVASNAANSSWV